MFKDEKRGRREHPSNLLQGFTEVVNESGLKDLGFMGAKFTWERSRGSHTWVQERLDKGLANQSWCQFFPLADVRMIEVATSDYLPLYLQLNKQVYRKKKRSALNIHGWGEGVFASDNVWVTGSSMFGNYGESEIMWY